MLLTVHNLFFFSTLYKHLYHNMNFMSYYGLLSELSIHKKSMFKLQCSKLFIFLFPLIHKRCFQTFPILKSGEKRQSVERLS